MFAGPPTNSVARMFFACVGVGGWGELSLAEQCAQPHKNRRVVGWLMVTGRLAATAEYLVPARLNVGDMANRHHHDFFSRFCRVARDLGFRPKEVQLQWSTLVKIAVMHQVRSDRVTPAQLGAGRQALIEASLHHARSSGPSPARRRSKAASCHGGVTECPGRRATDGYAASLRTRKSPAQGTLRDQTETCQDGAATAFKPPPRSQGHLHELTADPRCCSASAATCGCPITT